MTTKYMFHYQGFPIFGSDDGWYWANGPEEHGYFETLDEAKLDIQGYNEELLEHEPR